MAATRNQLRWPEFKVGLGEAMTKEQVAARLGITTSGFVGRLYRRGSAAVPVPTEDGWAFPPEVAAGNARLQPVPFWYERTILPYGKLAGDLDEHGRPVAKQTGDAA